MTNKIKHAILFILLTGTVYGQFDNNLIRQLDSMEVEDQKWRNFMTKINNKEIDTISRETVNNKMIETDSLNYHALKRMFDANDPVLNQSLSTLNPSFRH
jgi:hypothetical protein